MQFTEEEINSYVNGKIMLTRDQTNELARLIKQSMLENKTLEEIRQIRLEVSTEQA